MLPLPSKSHEPLLSCHAACCVFSSTVRTISGWFSSAAVHSPAFDSSISQTTRYQSNHTSQRGMMWLVNRITSVWQSCFFFYNLFIVWIWQNHWPHQPAAAWVDMWSQWWWHAADEWGSSWSSSADGFPENNAWWEIRAKHERFCSDLILDIWLADGGPWKLESGQ